ncbi:Uncharacterised protein [Fusobacterium necrophorum subsp. necrophorum]|nr:Uncharacterised protein [Fusobacterium necrophorum subsp. necrophorum]
MYERIEKQKEKFSDVRILFLNSKNNWEQLLQEEERIQKEEKELQDLEQELEARIEVLQNGKNSLEEKQLDLAKKLKVHWKSIIGKARKWKSSMNKISKCRKEREFHKRYKETESRLLFIKESIKEHKEIGKNSRRYDFFRRRNGKLA